MTHCTLPLFDVLAYIRTSAQPGFWFLAYTDIKGDESANYIARHIIQDNQLVTDVRVIPAGEFTQP